MDVMIPWKVKTTSNADNMVSRHIDFIDMLTHRLLIRRADFQFLYAAFARHKSRTGHVEVWWLQLANWPLKLLSKLDMMSATCEGPKFSYSSKISMWDAQPILCKHHSSSEDVNWGYRGIPFAPFNGPRRPQSNGKTPKYGIGLVACRLTNGVLCHQLTVLSGYYPIGT